MRPLTIEIHGTGTHNRGAELMAIAIAERMRATFPGVRIVVPPGFGSFEARSRYGFYVTDEFPGKVRWTAFKTFVTPGIRRLLGVISPKDVDAVLDASGFAFSDSAWPGGARELLKKMEHRYRKKQPLILLPQAFGPFDHEEMATQSRNLFARAALVCARDEKSLAAVQPLANPKYLVKYPDFTLGVRSILHPDLNLPSSFSAIVPSARMIDKTQNGEGYIRFLVSAIKLLKESGQNPVFLLHDAVEDRQVIRELEGFASLPVITHSDPRVLKDILGRAKFVIGSRFHALVSALSQGVPCIGLGWSHKYGELFRDFDANDLLVSNADAHDEVERLIRELSDETTRGKRSEKILKAAFELKAKTEEMWQNVEAVLQEAVPLFREARQQRR